MVWEDMDKAEALNMHYKAKAGYKSYGQKHIVQKK